MTAGRHAHTNGKIEVEMEAREARDLMYVSEALEQVKQVRDPPQLWILIFFISC